MGEITELRVRYGLELVDELTGAPPLGSVRVEASDPNAFGYFVPPARWIFERLDGSSVSFIVESDLYVRARLETDGSTDHPEIPGPSEAAPLAMVRLLPRTGYPFAAGLTRVVGMVRLDLGAGSTLLAHGALVELTPRYPKIAPGPGAPFRSGAVLRTYSTEDGQYTMWFLPEVSDARYARVATRCDVGATLSHDGSPYRGSATDVAITARRVTYIPEILLSPV